MSDQNRVPRKLDEPFQHRLHIGCVLHHIVVNIRQLLDMVGYPFMRIDKGRIAIDLLAFLHLHGRNFDDFVLRYR
ncbi:hypothetical protein D3C81_1166920 [compost metagenome]